ncbi:hypothetical protein P3S67_003465 [Capsicum chacoense]
MPIAAGEKSKARSTATASSRCSGRGASAISSPSSSPRNLRSPAKQPTAAHRSTDASLSQSTLLSCDKAVLSVIQPPFQPDLPTLDPTTATPAPPSLRRWSSPELDLRWFLVFCCLWLILVSSISWFDVDSGFRVDFIKSRHRSWECPDISCWRKMIMMKARGAGYLSDPHKARSQIGYAFICGGIAISWRYTKLSIVATLSNHTEIIAIHEASRECVWLRSMIHLIREKYGVKYDNLPIILYRDNSTYIAHLNRTKHILPKLFYIHELQKNDDINMQQIRSTDNVIDLFTKSSLIATFKKMLHKIGM